MGLVQSAASPALEVLLGAGLVFVLLAFMLIQREDLRNRVMRLFGKDFLRLRLDRGAKSYWIVRTPPGPPPQSMRNQF